MTQLSRRGFMKTSTAFAGLTVLVSNSPALLATENKTHSGIGPCLRFTEDGLPILCVPTPDMGQGMMTTAAQIIAEELDLDLAAVTVEFLPFIGIIDENGVAQDGDLTQGAGGSHSTMNLWPALRKTSAYVRALFIEGAAQEWGVPASQLFTAGGYVVNRNSGARLAYGELTKTAETVSIDKQAVKPKPIKDFKVVGKDAANVAALDIVTGKPVFASDIEVPGMLHAAIRRCPHLNGKLVSFNKDDIEALPGVIAVEKIDRFPEEREEFRVLSDGVAVIAETYWQAKKAADALKIEWDGEISKDDSTDLILEKCNSLLKDGQFNEVQKRGNVNAAFESAEKIVDVTYSHPSWAHTCIEPHNCIADVRADTAEIWVGHQNMARPANIAKKFADIDAANVTGHFYRMGTGFGRKYVEDFVAEAVILSKRMKAPVKVTWSREDEIEQDYPNHMGAYRIRAAIDNKSDLSGWHIKTALDTGRDWVARDFPANTIKNTLGEVARVSNNISRGAWRGPSHNSGAWVVQSALNEVAHATGRDPLEFLVALYNETGIVKAPNWPNRDIDFRRHAALLKKAAQESGYGRKLPVGWGHGIAVHHTFVSACAHVVELEMIGENDYRVHKVTSAIDCGLVVNPLGVRAQVESGIMDGLCTAKYGNLVFENGVPITNNFDSYQKMRIGEAPAVVDVHIMNFGDTDPRGTGEVSLPPLIPALTNAIFAASGKRVRTLPISENL